MALKGKGKQVAGKVPDAAASSSSGKRKKLVAEAEGSGSQRKKRRPGVLQFFDDAAVDADSDDEDKDLDLEGEDVGLDFMDAGKSANEDVRPVGKSNPLPFFLKEEELSGDELEALIKDRYGHGSEFVVYNEDSKERDDRESEVDSMKDPTVWRVKCMFGREREIAFCFMQKYIDLNSLGNKMPIISAFALDHVKGHVFIEADKECDVTEACKGFYSVYSSKISRVPGIEVPQLFSSRSKSCEVSEGSWVRMKSGKYKGDLAQVVAVDDGQKKVMVKLVPRVDLQAISKKFGGGISLKHAPVPAPRLISSHELEMFRPHIEVRRDRQTGEFFEILDGLMLKDGFLYKKVSVGSVICWGVQPSDMELLKFSNVSKDADEDLNWVSSVYDGRKKMRLSEAVDEKVLAKKGNGFNLHDFVLFGHKAFGVIIAVEKDGFRILKGGLEGGPEVATVKVQDIKSACVDKMFTASDRYMKTISINDTVKVLEGPLQDRQGIVRHMYKGTLFIYDENETENSGFFCAKSVSCENMKESKGEKSSHSFSQAPLRSYGEQDRSRGFNWRRRSDRDQLFSIGQTLRIRKGPLKGYLCRVVGVYRSDVTVKLDSLVKVITVEAEYLSVPNVKRDDSAATTSNPFGTEEKLSIGQQADNGQWDAGVPSISRDSWQAFPASNISDRDNNDHKADEGRDADPWGSKVISGSKADAWHSSKATDGWGKAAGSSREQDSQWNMTTGEKITDQARSCIEDADGWNGKALARTTTEIDASKKSELQSSDAWGWGRDNFGSGNNLDPSGNVLENWDRQRADDLGDSLKNSDGVSGWDRAATSKDKGKGLSWDLSDNWTLPEVNNDKVSSWDAKGKGIICNEDNSWGKASRSQEKNANEDWGKLSVGSRQIEEKGTTRSDGGEQADRWGAAASNWTQSAVQHGGQSGSWDKARDLRDGQLDKSEGETGGWNKSGFSSQSENARWEKPESFGGGKPGGQSSSWDKAKDPHGGQSDSWGKVNETSEAETRGWSKAGFSSQSENVGGDEHQNARWDGSTSFGGDNAFNWRKGVDGNDRMDNWKKPRNFEGGRGFGQGRGRGWNAEEGENRDRDGSWNNTTSSDGSQNSSCGKGWDRNDKAGGDGGQENHWIQQTGSDGGRGSRWGGGRGRYGARGDRGQDDNWNGPGAHGGWGSARGGGRGRNGIDDNTSFDGAQSFGRGRGHGRGRGRGHGHGWVQSSNLKDDQEYCRDGAFQKNPSSSWANSKTPGWAKLKGFSEIEESAENIHRQGGWNGRKPFDAGCSSGWGGQSSDWKKDEAGNNWSSCNSSNWNKEAFVKDAAGGGDNWNMSNRSGGNQSSGWDKWSSGNEVVDKAGAGSGEVWNSLRPSDKKQYSGWADKTLAGNEEVCGKTVGGQEHEADPWGSKMANGGSADAWNSSKAADNWGKATGLHIEQISSSRRATVGEKAVDEGQDGDCPKDTDGWNRTSFKSSPGIDGCEKAKQLPSMDAGESWDKAETNKDKRKGVSWDKPGSWACPEVSNDKVNLWDIKGKGLVRNEADAWGKSSKSQENNNESKDWGSNSSQNREENKFIGGNKANNWDAAASRWTQSTACGGWSSSWDKANDLHVGQSDNWGKAREKSEAEAGGWSETGFSSQSQNARWDETKSFGGDKASKWSKGIDNEDAFRNGRPDNWNKPRNFQGGRGFGRGRGRGRNAGENGNRDQDGNWNKPMDRDGGQRSSWGGGREGNNEAGGGRGQESNWNWQRDFGGGGDGGRGSNWERVRGRSGARGGRGQGDKWNGPEDKEWGWGSSRGGGWGRNGEAGDGRNDSDGRRSYGRGRGCIHSSKQKEEQENLGDGTFQKASASNWANKQSSGWGKLDEGKSFEAGGSSNCSKQPSDWNADGASNKWSSPVSGWNQGVSVKKAAGGGDNWNMSNPGGSHSSDWDKWSSGDGKAGKSGAAAEGEWNNSKPSAKEHSFGWGDKTSAGNEAGGNNGGNNWNTTKAAGGSLSAWDKSSAGNEEAVAAGISSKAKEDEGSGHEGSSWENAAAAWTKAKDGSAGN